MCARLAGVAGGCRSGGPACPAGRGRAASFDDRPLPNLDVFNDFALIIRALDRAQGAVGEPGADHFLDHSDFALIIEISTKHMGHQLPDPTRSEEHTSELQSLMRISYAVFCLKKKNKTHN